jgi:hypothetical protein
LLSYVSRNLYVREKICPIKKHKFFLLQVFDLRFFTKLFILQQCLDPNPNSYPNPNFFSESDPVKLTDSFVFGFGSTTLVTVHTGIWVFCYKLGRTTLLLANAATSYRYMDNLRNVTGTGTFLCNFCLDINL